jgi:hypothetical protein
VGESDRFLDKGEVDMPKGVYIRTEATKLALSAAQKGKTIPLVSRGRISDGLKKVACLSRFNPGVSYHLG